MADLKAETIEPDPTAASASNEKTVSAAEDMTVSTETKDVAAEAALAKQDIKDVEVSNDVAEKANGADSETKEEGAKPENGIDAEPLKKSDEGNGADVEDTLDSKKSGYNKNDKSKQSNGQRKPYNKNGPHTKTEHRHNHFDNVKSDFVGQEKSSDPVEIRKQVEFYFSDANLYVDKFLYSQVEGPKNVPVSIGLIHSFKRMRHFQPYSAIVAALKESTTLDVVDNDTCIQRKVPLPEIVQDKPHEEVQKVYEDAAMARTIYAKGFGEEQHSTQFDIEAYFVPHGPTNSVRLRRAWDKSFKGSVFVEFDSEETMKKFLALEPKPKFNGNELIVKTKKQYCDEKVEDIQAGRLKPKGHGAKRTREDEDGRDWRERRSEDQKRGFKDSRQDRGHKGYGSSGRGGNRGGHRGNNRGHRGGNRGGGDRGGDGRKKNEETEQGNTLKDGEIPKVSVSTDPPAAGKDNLLPTPVKSTPQQTNVTEKKKYTPPKVVDPNYPATTEKPDAPQASETPATANPDSTKSEGTKKRSRQEDGSPENEPMTKKALVENIS